MVWGEVSCGKSGVFGHGWAVEKLTKLLLPMVHVLISTGQNCAWLRERLESLNCTREQRSTLCH